MPSTCLVAELLSSWGRFDPRLSLVTFGRISLWLPYTQPFHATSVYILNSISISNLFLLTHSPHLRSRICRPLLVSPWRKVHDLNRWMSLTHTHTFHLLRDGFVESELLIGSRTWSPPLQLYSLELGNNQLVDNTTMWYAWCIIPSHRLVTYTTSMNLAKRSKWSSVWDFINISMLSFILHFPFFIDCCLSLAFHDVSEQLSRARNSRYLSLLMTINIYDPHGSFQSSWADNVVSFPK